MAEPTIPTPELQADLDRLRSLVAAQGTSGMVLPERRDMEALAHIVEAVPGLLTARAGDARRERGGKVLGEIVVRLAELIKTAFAKGETDPAGALLMLGDHLAELLEDEGGLPSDDHNRVYRALERRRDEVERLSTELAETQREREQYRLSLPAEVQDYWAWRKRCELVEAELDAARAEVERLRAELATAVQERHDFAANLEALYATDPEQRGLGGLLQVERMQRKTAEEGWEKAEAERDEAREQATGMVRILNGLLRHADLTDDVRIEIQNALGGTEPGRD
ncbi:hypothetical protein [Actinomadura geliboluensis]|uniref:hypothetical protein n=1 Tax=Actinomadura geliboluensis TaxID=882440 RepID=UPI0036B64BF0